MLSHLKKNIIPKFVVNSPFNKSAAIHLTVRYLLLMTRMNLSILLLISYLAYFRFIET